MILPPGAFICLGLLLAGVVVNAFFSAVIMFLASIARGQQLYATMFWLMGNMTEEDFFVLWVAGGCVVAGITALFFLGPQLNAISFGHADAPGPRPDRQTSHRPRLHALGYYQSRWCILY